VWGHRPGVGVSNLRLTRGGGVTDVNLHQLLKAAVDFRASELMLLAHAPPALRVDGELIPLKVPPLSPEGIQALVFKVLKPAHQAEWEKDHRMLRIAFGVKDLARFRMTVYQQRETMAATVKVIPSRLPALAPALERMKQWLQQPAGLYLIAGNSGSGRTWAFSALMDQVLVNEKVKLAAAQDPIEFVLPHKNSFVEQFEAGIDFQTAEQAVERLLATSGDVLGWDFPLNHGAALVTLAQSGKRVIATMLAASAEQVVAEILRIAPGAAPLIQEVAYLELSPPAKGRPRELRATIGSLQELRSTPAMAPGPRLELTREEQEAEARDQQLMAAVRRMNEAAGNANVPLDQLIPGAQRIPELVYWATLGNVGKVKQALNQGADINAGEEGYTALHAAAENGHPAVVQLLIEQGANVNARLQSGSRATPLELAAEHPETAALLRKHGATSSTANPPASSPTQRGILSRLFKK